MIDIQALPFEPEQEATADASDLASAITLINSLKAKYNDLTTQTIIPLLGEINANLGNDGIIKDKVVNDGA